jgi:hypothetical protein
MLLLYIQRELEALFDRYDEDCSGSLDYNEFGQHLLGLKAPPCSDASKSAIERVSLSSYVLYAALILRLLMYCVLYVALKSTLSQQ